MSNAQVKLRDRVIAEACAALDLADNIIAVNMGTDTPKEWDQAMRKVAKARSALTEPNRSQGIEAARSGRVEEVIRDADYALAEALRCASKVQP